MIDESQLLSLMNDMESSRSALKDNGSPPPQFEFGDTFFGARIEARP